jgi:putative ABC transport system permease protein
MSTFSLVWNYLKAKPMSTVLNIFLLSLGIAVITILLLFSNQLKERISQNAKGIDLVVGAKGSPLQLILCNIFHVDFPTGNIKLNEAERLAKHRLVKMAIPLALGDSYKNFRIVGTNQDYPRLYRSELSSGQWWSKDLEIVLGATAAEVSGLKIGDRFSGAHGLTNAGHDHEETLFQVTGILKKTNTVLDNLLLTNVGSIWKVHEKHEDAEPEKVMLAIQNPSPVVPSVEAGDSILEITALLVQYRNPIAALQLPRFINSQSKLQAASPAFETARLFSILGVGVEALMGFAYVLIFISGLSIFIALYNSLKERQYDLAIMRSMGAGRVRLFVVTVLEGSTLTILGSIIGLALGHAVLFAFTQAIVESQKTGITALTFYREEIFILLGSIVLGIVCSLIPAIQAYRTDIHKVLAGS